MKFLPLLITLIACTSAAPKELPHQRSPVLPRVSDPTPTPSDEPLVNPPWETIPEEERIIYTEDYDCIEGTKKVRRFLQQTKPTYWDVDTQCCSFQARMGDETTPAYGYLIVRGSDFVRVLATIARLDGKSNSNLEMYINFYSLKGELEAEIEGNYFGEVDRISSAREGNWFCKLSKKQEEKIEE